MKVRCPTCAQPAEYAPTNTFRPFCSERCRLIDLGNWADGTYAIPLKPSETEATTEYPVDTDSEDPEDVRH